MDWQPTRSGFFGSQTWKNQNESIFYISWRVGREPLKYTFLLFRLFIKIPSQLLQAWMGWGFKHRKSKSTIWKKKTLIAYNHRIKPNKQYRDLDCDR